MFNIHVPFIERKGFSLTATLILLGCLGLQFSSCISATSERGVEIRWRADSSIAAEGAWEKGESTKAEVLKALGPPSQVVSLGEETVFYYLRENMKMKGLVLLFYNDVRVSADYSRAIFFFNKDGILSDLAVGGASNDTECSSDL